MSDEMDPVTKRLLSTTDAAVWAAEFRKTALSLGYSDMDEGWLLGWFANAIETAKDRARREAALDSLVAESQRLGLYDLEEPR